MDNLSIYELYIHNFMKNYQEKYPDSKEIQNKVKHILSCGRIAKKLSPEDEMLYIGTLFHDMGRFIQYDQIHTFDDNRISHCIVGRDYFDMVVASGKIPQTDYNPFFRMAIRWHETGLPELHSPDVLINDFVNTIRSIDMIENGCIGVMDYLEREIQDDAKGYATQNSTMSMQYIRPRYMELFTEYEPMIKDCTTYAEYLLFAAHLTVQSLINYPIAEQVLDPKIIPWYQTMFNKYMNASDAKKAYEVLQEVTGNILLAS